MWNFTQFEEGNERFKGTEYSVRFLCRESIIKDVMTLVFNSIARSDNPISPAEEEEEGEHSIEYFDTGVGDKDCHAQPTKPMASSEEEEE